MGGVPCVACEDGPTALAANIQSVPTVALYRYGVIADWLVGDVRPEAIRTMLDRWALVQR